MSIEVGDDDLNLCFNVRSRVRTTMTGHVQQCFRARIIASAAILPGYPGFSSFQSIAYLDPAAVLTED
jgi:hypothetical protein